MLTPALAMHAGGTLDMRPACWECKHKTMRCWGKNLTAHDDATRDGLEKRYCGCRSSASWCIQWWWYSGGSSVPAAAEHIKRRNS